MVRVSPRFKVFNNHEKTANKLGSVVDSWCYLWLRTVTTFHNYRRDMKMSEYLIIKPLGLIVHVSRVILRHMTKNCNFVAEVNSRLLIKVSQ